MKIDLDQIWHETKKKRKDLSRLIAPAFIQWRKCSPHGSVERIEEAEYFPRPLIPSLKLQNNEFCSEPMFSLNFVVGAKAMIHNDGAQNFSVGYVPDYALIDSTEWTMA